MIFDIPHPELLGKYQVFYNIISFIFKMYDSGRGKRNRILQKSELFLLVLFSSGNFTFFKNQVPSKNLTLGLSFFLPSWKTI